MGMGKFVERQRTIAKRVSVADSQWKLNVIDQVHKQWKLETIQSIISATDLEAIKSIQLSFEGCDEALFWHPNKSGIYTVKSGYQLAKVLSSSSPPDQPSSSFLLPPNFWKHIWTLQVPQKIRHFWWRFCKNLLATKVNLSKCRCAASNMCSVCLKEEESVEHLLFDCGWTKAVWFGSMLKWTKLKILRTKLT
ncbi:hypothetical protein CsSME_00036510 [Camellia sinensis var. sinensis]